MLNQSVANLSTFWGVGVDADTPTANASVVTAEVNDTPVTWAEYPAGKLADSFNMTSGKIWTNGYPTWEGSNESEFVTWCRSVGCHAILSVPGEIDDPALAAYEVRYTENNLSFYPAYWEIGDEPAGWMHFGLPWTNWTASDADTVNATTYAQVVHAYVSAMKAVDSSIQILGLPGVGAGSANDTPWINATVKLNGPNLSGLAVHEYPAEKVTTGTLAAFYGTLGGSNGLKARLVADEKAIAANCATCKIPLLVDEFGSGTGTTGGWQPFMQTYPQVPYVAAELVTMMETGVYNAELYDLRSAYNGSLFNLTGVPRPLDGLYAQILPHFGSTVLGINVTKSASGVFVAASESAPNATVSVLAVNTGTTTTDQLDLGGPLMPTYGSYATWRAVNSSTSPNGSFTDSTGFGTTTTWSLPPQSVLLVSVCRPDLAGVGAGHYSVTFCESGLPASTNWSVTLGGVQHYSTGTTVSFLEPNGTYSYSYGIVSGWHTPAPTSSVTVHGGNASVQVPWARTTYLEGFLALNLTPGTRWSVTVDGKEYRSNVTTLPLSLPNGTHNFTVGRVPGWQPNVTAGSFIVNASTVVIPINWSRVTYRVAFEESGLPLGTNWSVTLDGLLENGTGPYLNFSVPNGTYAYAVGNVSGYTPSAFAGALTVNGGPVNATISWSVAPFSIVLHPVGLPPSTAWSVDLNGTPQAGTGNFTFYEPAGTYAYTLGPVPGWTRSNYHGSVGVTGPTVVNVAWTQFFNNVTFRETNLPLKNVTWTTNWSVTVNTTTKSTHAGTYLTFWEPNGTYCYTVPPAGGFQPSQPTGCFALNGTGDLVVENFTRVLYTVTFNETGLPHSTTWYINITDHPSQKSFGASEPIHLPNGTYSFTIASVNPKYAPIPRTGNFTIAGGPVYITIRFGLGYNVTFTESGLPSGTVWTVAVVNESVNASANGTLGFFLANATYTYRVGLVSGYLTNQSGTLIVPNGPKSVSIVFVRAEYALTFTETGLASGTSWSVTITNTSSSSSAPEVVHGTTSSLVGYESNGTTFRAVYQAFTGWKATPEMVNFSVSGESLAFNVTYSPINYTVTFTERGLPSGTNWSVTLLNNSSTFYSVTDEIVFPVTDGNYSFHIDPVPGYQPASSNYYEPVFGGDVAVTVVFTVYSYPVWFNETGLPNGTTWSVVFNGNESSTNGTSLEFRAPNGTDYPFRVVPIPGWIADPSRGTVGSGSSVTIAWTRALYTVTFEPTGLPNPTTWCVVLDGINLTSSTGGAISFDVPNGTYGYSICHIAGFVTSAYNGSVVVNGANVPVTVRWTPVYTVTFTEQGLAPGTPWSVTLAGIPVYGTGATLWFNVTNGSYRFSVGAIPGWTATPASGSFKVAGVAVAIKVVWTEPTYAVVFTESGLPTGTYWSVTIGGNVASSHGTMITLQEPNGSWAYSVASVTGWVAQNASGTVTVDGAGVSVPVLWLRPLYTVTFTETGLPGGTSWSVTLNGSTASGNGSTLRFQEADRTYVFSVGAVPGYTANPQGGSVLVNGTSVLVTVQFSPKSTPGASNNLIGVPPLETVALLAVIVVAVALVWFATHRTPPARKGPVQPYTPPPEPPAGP